MRKALRVAGTLFSLGLASVAVTAATPTPAACEVNAQFCGKIVNHYYDAAKTRLAGQFGNMPPHCDCEQVYWGVMTSHRTAWYPQDCPEVE